MDQEDALKIIINMGNSYFYDVVSDYETNSLAVNSIFTKIKDYASRSKPTPGPGSWLVNEEATRIAVQEINADILDQILEHTYGIWPDQVGGGKAFFERLHATIIEGIDIAKSRNLN